MAAKKEKSNHSEEILALYDNLIAALNGVERKGATMPYTSVNGHMFSFIDKTGALGLRLREDTREKFLEKYTTTLCEANGTILREYVLVPEKLFKNIKELKPFFISGYEYAKSLKPKPPKKKKNSLQ